MFEALRKNIQSVQEGISAGLQRLSVSERTTPTTPTDSKLDFAAGSDLMQLYQTQWATMHHMAEQNSNLAEKLDTEISSLVEECETQHSQLAEIHSLLAHLPNIMSQLHSLLTTIGTVRGLFEEVEGELIDLEDLSEELNQQEKILDMRLGLALNRERSTHKLNQLKKELTTIHTAKMEVLEKVNEVKRKEKEEEFKSQFLKDMQDFKKEGTIKRSVPESSSRLEDIDIVDEDKDSLDAFLDEPT